MNARGKKFSLNFRFENGILVGLYVESEDATPRDPSQ